MNNIRIAIPLVFIASACAYNDINDKISCEDSDLSISVSSKLDVSSCKAIDGVITVQASGGKPGYDFSLNGGIYQTNPQFENLAPGIYEIQVKDFLGCKASVSIELTAPNSTLNASIVIQSDDQCLTNNGSISVTGQGGTGVYQFQLGSNGFSTTGTFENLKHGIYSVIIKDSEDCQKVLNVTVPRGLTGVRYATEIKPIFDANCNLSGCHGSGTGSRDWTNFSNIRNRAAQIKARTVNKSMPIGGFVLTQEEIDLISCWVDDGTPDN
ncbi:MAG: hypothetical protein JNJ65_15805 [Cyclobacteriaceae bacterium]|nr:hypothetical protein [Cyclobacteriaceae bacterium]